MREITPQEALLAAAAAIGTDAASLAAVSDMGLFESAVHAPFMSFAGVEPYPDIVSKAAVLASRIVKNHALPNGNKRAAWASMRLFLALNGVTLRPDPHGAVHLMCSCAQSSVDGAYDMISQYLKEEAVL